MEGWIVWLKIAHVSALSIWVAGLFYLPALFAAHREKDSLSSFHRLRAITRVAYLGISSPAAVIAILTGVALIYPTEAYGAWFVVKLIAVSLMVFFHVYCGSLLVEMREPGAARRPAAMVALMLAPFLLVPAVLYLVLAKPI
jgi:protoporphyrinogen IX oxidase